MKIYMRVTNDELELPVAIADTQAELARMVGVKSRTVTRALSEARRGVTSYSIYKEVEVEDD
jgi:predicted DNA-binding protein (UPF0251 family)